MATTGIWIGIPADMDSLASSVGSTLVGYDDTNLQTIADSSRPIANYATLRAFKGRATGVKITDIATGGLFQRDDADTTSADNGATVIVDGSNRRWKRLMYAVGSAGAATFASLTGVPADNLYLATVLNGKEPSLPAGGTSTTFLAGDRTWRVPAGGAGGGAAAWGTVSGSLRDQTDLANALDAKETRLPVGGTSAQYLKGDKTLGTLDKIAVGLPNVDNTADSAKPLSAAVIAALAGKEPAFAAGTALQYVRADKTVQTLDKIAVGLPNVDNTSDAAKPVSAATITALSLKANAANTVLTGTPTAPTAAPGTNSAQLATTAFVMTALGATPTTDPLVTSTMTNINNVSAAMRLRTLIIGAE